MSRRLFIDPGPLETRVAVIENDAIAEIHIARTDVPSPQGQIRRARVTQIAQAMNAAILDAGEGVELFLRAADARALNPEVDAGKQPVGRLVSRGQMITVQVGRPGQDGKQARASADITLGARTVLLRPLGKGLTVERGAGEVDIPEALAVLAEDHGLILRRAAREAEAEQIVADAERLVADWQQVAENLPTRPGLVRPAPTLIERALVDLAGDVPDALMVPARAAKALLRGECKRLAPDLIDRIEVVEPRRSLDLDDALDTALQAEVAVGRKARLFIEPTRAMTVIDVDGNGAPLDINLAAIPEIARQIRLRRLGGLIAVDFVTLSRTGERKKVEAALRKAMRADPEPVDIGEADRRGVIILSRRGSGPSLAAQLGQVPRPHVALNPEAELARLVRRAAVELEAVGPLPMQLSLPERLRAAAPDDLAARLAEALGRPLAIVFAPGGGDDFRLERLKG